LGTQRSLEILVGVEVMTDYTQRLISAINTEAMKIARRKGVDYTMVSTLMLKGACVYMDFVEKNSMKEPEKVLKDGGWIDA
jgi:hypothetical protein